MSSSQRRALVIEDDENLARAVALLLEDQGFEVELRHDGESGLHAALEESYDVLVLDVMLPKRNGFSVCSDLRKAGNFTPLLMLTAKEGELDEVEGLEVGADDFLRKPFENAVLVARIQALLRRQDRGRPKDLVAGHITIDPLLRRVTVDNAVVTFTPREYALLHFLLCRANTSVSKADILEHVWGAGFDGDPNIVEVYIGYLRKKIDLAHQPSVIATVRGVGYTVRTEQ